MAINISRKLLFFLIVGLVSYFILSRLRLVVLVHVSLWQGLLITGIAIVVLFLLVEHLLFRTRTPRS
jgi:hypothetical protein